MANYTIADIQALRERTGAGMMDVKKALDEADGDADKALEIIRVKGLAGVSKREGRAASDGLVTSVVNSADAGEVGVMVEVNSETDFVAKNENFVDLAATVLQAAVTSSVTDTETLLAQDVDGKPLSETVDEFAAVVGERIVVRRVARVEGESVTTYLHRTSPDLPPQVGVLVAAEGGDEQTARDIAMHIAAFSPTYLSRDDVPQETVDKEREIAETTARNENRPEQAIPRIIEGRLNAYFKEYCLLDQGFAKDPKKTVADVASDAGLTVTDFARFRVGS
ncbi:MAG TPA: translation elongation factor Ts [Beutenbergiaceae bacterium]|nr:translation elongation factor Ts [Beutenbergiaceae bacterium]